MRECAIPSCGSPVKSSHGWCGAHYMRWLRHGDPLGGRPSITPKGVSIRYLREEVLTYGGDECLPWPFGRSGDGYGAITIDKVTTGVHRLVCEHVHGPAPTPEHQAAHSCANGHLACVTPGHLSWKTPLENSADMIMHGNSLRGERNVAAKLTEPEAREILALKGKLKAPLIAERFGVSVFTVYAIHGRKIWAVAA